MKITKFNPTDGINSNDSKEDKMEKEYAVITYTKKGFKNPIVLRTYRTSARAYACLWVWHPEKSCNGSGWAGGSGYHRASAAAQGAFFTAGVQLSEDIDGRGESAIVDALKALAKELGYDEYCVHTAHGKVCINGLRPQG